MSLTSRPIVVPGYRLDCDADGCTEHLEGQDREELLDDAAERGWTLGDRDLCPAHEEQP